jgi:cardiolipin synthase C
MIFKHNPLSCIICFFLCVLASSCSQPKENNSLDETDFCSSIHRNDSISLSRSLEPLDSLMQKQTGVYVLEDGGGAMVARAWLSEYAEKSIDIQYFIFSTDNVGLIACDYLVRAADRGVKVRILVDDIMVDTGIEDVLKLDSHQNIEIRIYNPGVNLGKNIFDKIKKVVTDFRGINQRMHNKTFTVDGKVSITGGRNIANEYFDFDREYNFRDRDVLLLGKSVGSIQISFEQFWNHDLSVPVGNIAGNKIADTTHAFHVLHQYACNPENFWPQVRERIQNLPAAFNAIRKSGEFVWVDSVVFVSDLPGKNDASHGLGGGGASTDALIALVQSATVSIDIQSPYLVTTALSRNLFREAVKRGVRVRILTNSLASTDNLEAFSGYQRDRKKLLETGVHVHEFKPDAAVRYKVMTGDLQAAIHHQPVFGHHAKSMVIDGKITVIGTFNLDPRSANLNTECVAIIYSDKIATGVLKGMVEEFKPENAWHTTHTFNPDAGNSLKKRVGTLSRRVVPKNIL